MIKRDHTKYIFHVCRTGVKEQFYTLYVESQTAWPCGARSHYSQFVQNLSKNLDDAVVKAQNMIQDKGIQAITTIEVHDSPRPIYTKYEVFGVEFKMAKRRNVWYAHAKEEFWEEWRTRKAEIKEAGYWVKRSDDGTWLVFKRIAPEEISWVVD